MSTLLPPVLADTALSVALQSPHDREIGALWRRILAFVGDSILIGIAANLFVWPFFTTLSRLRVWGPFVGFFIALPYVAIFNSRLGNGQTPGKRLLKLQVVNREGNTISFADSALRYAVFAIPYYLSDLTLPVTKTPWLASTFLAVVTGGAGACAIYLMLFNRRTRQGLHDLAAESFVADAKQTGPLILKPIWRTHWVILAVIALTSAVLGGLFYARWSKAEPFPELFEDVRLVEQMPGVQAAGAQALNAWGDRNKSKILVITVHWAGEFDDQEAFSDEVAKTLLEGDPKIQRYNTLRIVINRGYNIGIARAFVNQVVQRTPAEWRERLGLSIPEETPSKNL